MGEPLTGCNYFMNRNICWFASALVGTLGAVALWFIPLYADEAADQALLEQSFAAHVEGSREDQMGVDKKLDAIITGQNQLQQDMARVQERLGIPGP